MKTFFENIKYAGHKMDKVYRFIKALGKEQAKNIYSFAKKIEIPNKISISKDYRRIEIQSEENSFIL